MLGIKVRNNAEWFDDNDGVLTEAIYEQRCLLQQHSRSNQSGNVTKIEESDQQIRKRSREIKDK